jgi:hypothetical protein
MELDFSARPLLGRIDHARIERPRIDVQADGSLVEFPWIEHSMHRIGRIDSAGMRDVHLNRVQRLKPANAALQILMHEVEILDLQSAHRHRHPAILVAVVVH